LDDGEGLIDTRAALDAVGLTDVPGFGDTEGPSDQGALKDADARAMHDAEGLIDTHAHEDADGPTDARVMEDAEGPSDPRALHDAEGPVDTREMQYHHAMIAPSSELTGEFAESQEQIEIEAAEAAKEAEQSAYVDSILNAKAPDEATPWALSVHLEQRIQKLQDEKSKVNAQLDSLEVSSKKLEKRLSSI
jgi:hypothetical protein